MSIRNIQKKLNIMMMPNSMAIGGAPTYTLTLAKELKERGMKYW